jgi:hypothetical protein
MSKIAKKRKRGQFREKKKRRSRADSNVARKRKLLLKRKKGPSHALLYDNSLISGLLEMERQVRIQYVESLRAKDRVTTQAEVYNQESLKNKKRSGDYMLNALITCLARFDQTKYRRSMAQMEMHTLMTQACLPQIYGAEYLSKRPELLRRFGISTFNTMVAIFATRRFGKTFALAQFIAAFMWTQEISVINTFSLAARTSSAIVAKIVTFLKILDEEGKLLKFIIHNQETLRIRNAHGVESTAYSYPCSKIRFISFS